MILLKKTIFKMKTSLFQIKIIYKTVNYIKKMIKNLNNLNNNNSNFKILKIQEQFKAKLNF